ncbi:uncharacterized protein ppp1r3aa [Phyllopteryx taeniolatus]|uniref:uncharacterized protein ppp1r3aa n=1 Tax=Phyllopteryx taeniolatus TaxID=161469 RepID=UPI002AD20EDE|nr:uncharacterized protein ppp1r3aa [Phyllopteryx taeniolatus]
MEALSIQLLEEDRVSLGRQERKEEARMEAFSPWGCTTDEEEPEWEPPPVVRRKVSFADAFGLDLVSVKEYDEVNAAEDGEDTVSEAPPLEEFYLSCLFAAPSSEEELERRLETQMVELEKVELLPGTTTLRGSVRVINLCFSKSVYARITLDRWKSYFDLLADYVPGSSDRKTDRFTFRYTVVPPLEKEGTRVELCLRYETSAGTFWANNQEMNYVVFCHQKSPVKQQVQEDNGGLKVKRSCFRANRRVSAQEKESMGTATRAAEVEAASEAEETRAESQWLFSPAECKPLVASLKSRQRAARLAHVKEIFSQSWGQASSCDPMSTLQPSGEFLLKRQRKQVLTYHQIPLITLDWDNDKQQQWVSSNMDNIWSGRAKVTLSKASEENVKGALSVNDIWGTFLNGKGPSPDNESSVCDVWQAFIHGPRYEDNCGVPESEWLQNAASVPPTSEKRQVPANARPATSAASAVGQAPSHASPAHVSSYAEDRQPSETRGGRSRGENRVAATLGECGSAGAVLAPCGSVDSLSECHKHGEERKKGGIQGDEAVATSPRESTTTGMTAEAENAGRDGDRISREDTGGAHNATDDSVAFWDTIGHGAKDAARRGAEDGIIMNCMRAVTSTEEEEVKPQENDASANQTAKSPVESNESRGIKPADEINPNQIGSVESKTEGVASRMRHKDIKLEETFYRSQEFGHLPEEKAALGDRVVLSNCLGDDTSSIIRENHEGLIDPSAKKVDDNLLLTHSQKQGFNPTMENISVELWNQPESSERGQKEQSSVDIVNFPLVVDHNVADTCLRSTESEPIVAEALAVIESRSDGGQIGDDLVRRVHGQTGRDPAGSNQISTEETGQPTRSPARGSGAFLWWSVLYILSHITRIVTCSLLVSGFFVVVVLYEFQAFFVLYMFSMAWWFYKWRSPRGATNKAIVS